jgi:hypothetical protein
MDRKGISNIVITVLIILISLVLIGILWVFFSPFLTTFGEATTNVIDCYAPAFDHFSCQYASALSGDPIFGEANASVPVVVKLRRLQGNGDMTGVALQFSNDGGVLPYRDRNVSLNEFETLERTYFLKDTFPFAPDHVELYLLVGPERKLCTGAARASVNCTPYPVPPICTDINCDGGGDQTDVSDYLSSPILYNNGAALGQRTTCNFNEEMRLMIDTGCGTPVSCPDIDGDGVVREFDPAALINAIAGGGAQGCDF